MQLEIDVVRLGVIGLGAAGQAFLPAIAAHPTFALAAVCDARSDAAGAAARAHGVAGFTDVGAMLAQGDVDAVYIGTPTELHLDHTMQVLESGRHVLVEKPLAVSIEDCLKMADAARDRGLALTVGHSHSFDRPVAAMREIIRSGELGRPRMINTWCYTDWVYRPRRPDELRPEIGGGVTYRQGAHQFEILRALCDAPPVTVFARAFDHDPQRQTIGAHSATLAFADGTIATAVYSGYGRFFSSELTRSVGEWGFIDRGDARNGPAPAADPAEELARKQKRALTAIGNDAPHQPHFGLTLVSCERGDIRQSPDGLLVYTADGCEERPLPNDKSPRHLVLDEFAEAIGGAPTFHDGYHGAAILEICAAVLESTRTGNQVTLRYQERGDRQ